MISPTQQAILRELAEACDRSEDIRFGQLVDFLGFFANRPLAEIEDEELLRTIDQHVADLRRRAGSGHRAQVVVRDSRRGLLDPQASAKKSAGRTFWGRFRPALEKIIPKPLRVVRVMCSIGSKTLVGAGVVRRGIRPIVRALLSRASTFSRRRPTALVGCIKCDQRK